MEKKWITIIASIILLIFILLYWGAVLSDLNNRLNNRRYEPGACGDARLIIHACYDNLAKETQLTVGRDSRDFILAGMNVIVKAEEKSKRYVVNETSANLKVRMFDGVYSDALNLPSKNEERTYIINTSDFSKIEELRVGPIVRVGYIDKMCDTKYKLKPRACL